MADLATAYIQIIPTFKDLDKNIRTAFKKVEPEGEKSGKSVGKKFSDSFTAQLSKDPSFGKVGDKLAGMMGKTLKAGVVGVGVAAGGAMAGAFTKGFGRLNALDQAEAKLKGLKLGAEEVDRAMQGVNASVKGTAFGLDEAAGSAGKFVGVGIEVGDELDRAMKLTADIAAQAGSGMDEISSIVAKVAGAGKVTGETLAQLDDRAVGASGALADHLGVSIDEVREQISAGEVDFETFSEAMEEHIGGAAQSTGETFKGAFDNMWAAMGRFGASMLDPVFDAMPAVFGAVGQAFDDLGEKLEPVAESFGEWLAPRMQDFAENTVPRLVDGLLGVVDRLIAVGEWVQKNSDWLGPLAVAVGTAATYIGAFTGAVKLAEGAMKLFTLSLSVNPIMLVIGAITALVAGLMYFFTQTETGRQMWANFTDFIGRKWGEFGAKFNEVITNVQQWWAVGVAAINVVADGMRAKIAEVIAAVVTKFTEWRDHTSMVIGVIKGFFQGFADKVRSTSSQAVGYVRDIPGKIKDAFSNAGSWLVDSGRQMIQGLIDGIQSMGRSVGNAIQNVIPFNVGGMIPGLSFGGVAGFARGGVLPDIPGVPRSHRDPILGVSGGKIPIARVEPGEFVVNREATAKHLPLLRAINGGDFTGAMGELPGYAAGGVIQAMKKIVFAKYPNWGMISDYRAGDPGYHGKGLAVDFSNGTGNTPQQLALARDINRVYPESAQLIYAAPGWSGNIYEGRPAGAMDSGIYKTAQAGRHDHHVHWAMKTPPTKPLDGPVSPGGAVSEMESMPPMKWSEKGLTYNAVRAARALALKFPQIKMIGGYRAPDPYPDHPSGRALDVMTYADMSLGDRVKDFLFNNDFKMQYALWRQAQWNNASASTPMADRGSGTANHMDHVHAYFAASPRATGGEKYPPVGLSGTSFDGANVRSESEKPEPAKSAVKEFQIDWGTASGLAGEYDKEQHRKRQLKRFSAGVFDTGGIMRHGTAAVNLSGRPERVLDPRMTAAFEKFVAHVPGLADAIEKFAATDWNVVGQELAAAFHGRGVNYDELGKVVGEQLGERITDGLAFIGHQVRDMQDGSNMRAYLSNMSATEAVGLSGQVGALFGGGKLSAALGGVAKGYDGLKDAAVAQVDAADAVKQAEKNLSDARAQAKEITADSNATEDDKAKATEAVTKAEDDYAKAKGVVKMAAQASGQAQIAMALEVAEVVVKAVKWVFAKVQDVFAGVTTAWNTIGDMFGAIAEYQGMVRGFREDVTRLALDQALAQVQLAAAHRKVRMTAMDGVTAQLQGIVDVAEAQAAFDESLQADIVAANMAYDGLGTSMDEFRHNVFKSFDEITAANVEWSDKTWSLWWDLQAARTGQLILEKQAQKDLLEAQYDSILAAIDLREATTQLDKAAEKLAIASGEAFGMSEVEATTAERWAKLQGEKAELMAKQARGRNVFAWNWGAVAERQRRINQIEAESRELETREDFNITSDMKREADKMVTRAGAMGFFGAGDDVAEMVKNSQLGDATRQLEKIKRESDLVDLKAKDQEFRDEIERKKTEIDRREAVAPIDLMIKALTSEQDAQKTYGQMYRTDNEQVRDALLELAKQQENTAQNVSDMSRAAESEAPKTVNLVGNTFNADALEKSLAELGIRVRRIENPRATGAQVAASRR